MQDSALLWHLTSGAQGQEQGIFSLPLDAAFARALRGQFWGLLWQEFATSDLLLCSKDAPKPQRLHTFLVSFFFVVFPSHL